ncbi:Uncharacterised protein [uncultured archaeon]|nr:Uncharacterised protein [uncultured archaeon]
MKPKWADLTSRSGKPYILLKSLFIAMKGNAALFFIFIIAISAEICECTLQSFLEDSDTICRIDFESDNALIAPQMSFPANANWLNFYKSLPVYSEKQPMKGTILLPQNWNGSKIILCLSPFNVSQILSASSKFKNPVRSNCIELAAASDGGNNVPFALLSQKSGMYLLYVLDENDSTILSAAPLLITEEDVDLQAPSIVQANESFFQILMNTTNPGNQSKIFAAMMIASKDYQNSSLRLEANRSQSDFDAILALGPQSLRMSGMPKVSSELLMNILPLLPQNSAIGLQESCQSGVSLVLMTDKPWNNGNYILTCGVYSAGKGLLGIRQLELEVA